MSNKSVTLWVSELSPFALKLQAMLDYTGYSYRCLPAQGSRLENLRFLRRLSKAKRSNTILRFPAKSPMDEYPLVPYLEDQEGQLQFDSSAIAHWLDHQSQADQTAGQKAAPGLALVPQDPVIAFLISLIDEALDEFGLYMVHHARWMMSAQDNDAGQRLAAELRHLLPPGFGGFYARHFSRRQVRRLPYLFSVAPPGFDAGMPASLTPPSLPAWPQTHSLLENAWQQYLVALENILAQQPYLLGARFTLADASVYGQFAMNLKDPSAARSIEDLAPLTFAWLCNIRDGGHVNSTGDLKFNACLVPLLDIIMQTFAPLMVFNAQAYKSAAAAGQTRFNEKAFDQGLALYNGELLGQPFRSAAKRFQVRVWLDLCDAWQRLAEEDAQQLKGIIKNWSLFEKSLFEKTRSHEANR